MNEMLFGSLDGRRRIYFGGLGFISGQTTKPTIIRGFHSPTWSIKGQRILNISPKDLGNPSPDKKATLFAMQSTHSPYFLVACIFSPRRVVETKGKAITHAEYSHTHIHLSPQFFRGINMNKYLGTPHCGTRVKSRKRRGRLLL